MAVAMDWVNVVRYANADVFFWPTPEWSLLYTHEELSELARVVQRLSRPEDLRCNGLGTEDLEAALHLEWGQALMMHLTTGLLLDIDPDRALVMALDRVWERSAGAREEAERKGTP